MNLDVEIVTTFEWLDYYIVQVWIGTFLCILHSKILNNDSALLSPTSVTAPCWSLQTQTQTQTQEAVFLQEVNFFLFSFNWFWCWLDKTRNLKMSPHWLSLFTSLQHTINWWLEQLLITGLLHSDFCLFFFFYTVAVSLERHRVSHLHIFWLQDAYLICSISLSFHTFSYFYIS